MELTKYVKVKYMASILQRYGSDICVLSSFSLFVTLWTIARQAPWSVGFSRQEYWSGLLDSPPGDLPNPGIELTSLPCPALVSPGVTWEDPRSDK